MAELPEEQREELYQALLGVADALSAPSFLGALSVIQGYSSKADELLNPHKTITLDPDDFAQNVAQHVDALAMARESQQMAQPSKFEFRGGDKFEFRGDYGQPPNNPHIDENRADRQLLLSEVYVELKTIRDYITDETSRTRLTRLMGRISG